MNTSKFLVVGDVFVLNDGICVDCNIPAKFVYENSKFSNKLVNHNVIVGKIYSVDSSNILKYKQQLAMDIASEFNNYLGYHLKLNDALSYVESVVGNKVDNNTFVLESGEFVVVKTAMEGGGRSHNDEYPDGHRVYCKRLNADGTYNPDGFEIQFYQSGCFTNVVEPDKITPIRTMRMILTSPTFV